MEKILSGFLNSQRAVRVAFAAALCWNTGFVHAPLPQWATGEVTGINPRQMTFVVRDDASRKLVLVRWNEETRLWIEPTRRNDRGCTFDASQIKTGAPAATFGARRPDSSVSNLLRPDRVYTPSIKSVMTHLCASRLGR